MHDGRGVANTDTRISSDGLAAASAKAMTDEAGPLAGQGAPQSTPKLCRAISALRDPPRAGGAYPPFTFTRLTNSQVYNCKGLFPYVFFIAITSSRTSQRGAIDHGINPQSQDALRRVT